MQSSLRVDNFLSGIDYETYLNRIIVKTVSYYTFTALNNSLVQFVNTQGLSITTKTFACDSLLAFTVILQVDANDRGLVRVLEDHLKDCGFIQRSVRLDMHETTMVSRSEFYDQQMSK